MSTDKRKGFFKRIFGTDNEATSDSQQTDDTNVAESESVKIDQTAGVNEARVDETTDPKSEPMPEPQAETQHEAEPDAVIEPETPEEPQSAPSTETSEAPNDARPTTETDEPKGWLARMSSGLAKTSNRLSGGITGLFTKAKLDDDAIQDLEDILIQSDLGVTTSSKITDRIAQSRFDKDLTPDDIRAILSEEVATVLKPNAVPLQIKENSKPYVIMMVGVNGAGKTTTIGKLAAQFTAQGKSVMLVACDTFRAAAVDQLSIRAERTGSLFMSRDLGADAAGLAFDAIQSARGRGTDIVMIDTAGRLQNKVTLMAELDKIIRVIKKHDDSAPHSTVLILDATTGQNALNQVEIFQKQAGISGLIMTKLDGTARGGILVAIAQKYALPIHAIGVGEQIDDLQPFDPNEFADAIAQT